MARNILKIAERYEQILKFANYPTPEKIAEVVKNTVDNLIAIHGKGVMQGVLFASNVQNQSTIEDIYVSFLLNLNNDPKLVPFEEANKPERDTLVHDAVLKNLQLYFKEFAFRVHFADFPTEKPGWFDKQPK